MNTPTSQRRPNPQGPQRPQSSNQKYVPSGPVMVELESPKKRIRFITIVFLVVMTLFMTRLVELQVVRGPALAATAQNSRLQTLTLPALRGNFTDSNGVPIATTVMARNVTVDPTLITDPAATAATLSPILGIPVEKLVASLTVDSRFSYVAKRITPETWKTVAALEIPGVFSEPTTNRVYPNGSLAATVIGYVGAEGTGLGGLEFGLNEQLMGTDGKLTVERVNGREIPASERQSIDPVDGLSVRLTLDSDLQAMLEESLGAQVKATGAEGGVAVIMEPGTGNILAMATYPTFDPNNPFATDDKAKRNTTVTDVFEPGSTSKVMTMASVVEEGGANPGTKYTIENRLSRGGTSFKDYKDHPTEHFTLAGVLAKSSNIGTILAAESIGEKKLYSYLQKFGIGQSTGMNFPGESSGKLPDINNENEWSDTTFPTLAFGQGLSVNAVQATSVFATIANDGVRMLPRLIAGYSNAQGAYEPSQTAEGVRVVSAATAKTVREMLETVVSEDGTGKNMQIPGYRVGGKTGTANRYDENTGGYSGYTSSFIGMAPAEKPALVMSVSIHNPKTSTYGSVVAGPVFKKVMTYALAHRKIPPSTTKPPKLPVEW
ncbi:MAG: penicillin-binding protein 2 [Actinobacteria bacterium]|nr:penicillin-binding protein 2 [Actinomycetota bacterium]